MTIAETIASITILYWFWRLMVPVLEWHEREERERRDHVET